MSPLGVALQFSTISLPGSQTDFKSHVLQNKDHFSNVIVKSLFQQLLFLFSHHSWRYLFQHSNYILYWEQSILNERLKLSLEWEILTQDKLLH